jgi:hypothetical protein
LFDESRSKSGCNLSHILQFLAKWPLEAPTAKHVIANLDLANNITHESHSKYITHNVVDRCEFFVFQIGRFKQSNKSSNHAFLSTLAALRPIGLRRESKTARSERVVGTSMNDGSSCSV